MFFDLVLIPIKALRYTSGCWFTIPSICTGYKVLIGAVDFTTCDFRPQNQTFSSLSIQPRSPVLCQKELLSLILCNAVASGLSK